MIAPESVYFRVGESALFAIKRALRTVGKQAPARILDLPCGHGRVLRWLRAAYADAEIVACDIHPDGVEFCAATFGAIPVRSRADPAEIPLEGEFDLIWCGSLLTHLDRERWLGFVDCFERRLAPDGVLVFTTHGRHVARVLREVLDSSLPARHALNYSIPTDAMEAVVRDFEREGFAFWPTGGTGDVGTSISSAAWVCASLERWSDLRLIGLTEQGWSGNQDVVACFKPAESLA